MNSNSFFFKFSYVKISIDFVKYTVASGPLLYALPVRVNMETF